MIEEKTITQNICQAEQESQNEGELDKQQKETNQQEQIEVKNELIAQNVQQDSNEIGKDQYSIKIQFHQNSDQEQFDISSANNQLLLNLAAENSSSELIVIENFKIEGVQKKLQNNNQKLNFTSPHHQKLDLNIEQTNLKEEKENKVSGIPNPNVLTIQKQNQKQKTNYQNIQQKINLFKHQSKEKKENTKISIKKSLSPKIQGEKAKQNSHQQIQKRKISASNDQKRQNQFRQKSQLSQNPKNNQKNIIQQSLKSLTINNRQKSESTQANTQESVKKHSKIQKKMHKKNVSLHIEALLNNFSENFQKVYQSMHQNKNSTDNKNNFELNGNNTNDNKSLQNFDQTIKTSNETEIIKKNEEQGNVQNQPEKFNSFYNTPEKKEPFSSQNVNNQFLNQPENKLIVDYIQYSLTQRQKIKFEFMDILQSNAKVQNIRKSEIQTPNNQSFSSDQNLRINGKFYQELSQNFQKRINRNASKIKQTQIERLTNLFQQIESRQIVGKQAQAIKNLASALVVMLSQVQVSGSYFVFNQFSQNSEQLTFALHQ